MDDVTHLNGWKEIAGYLGKSPRAAQRWERDLGLPVHRMRTPKGGEIVYAVPSEIDEWKARSDQRVEAEPPQPIRSGMVVRFSLVAAALLVATALVGAWRWPASAPAVEIDYEDFPRSTDAPWGLNPGPWPTQGHDVRRTHQNVVVAGPRQPRPPDLLFESDAASQISAIAVGGDGTIVISGCGEAIALDRNGGRRWTVPLTHGRYRESPAGFTIEPNGHALFGVTECPDEPGAARLGFFSVLPNGNISWVRQQGGVNHPPAVSPTGSIYVIDQTNLIRAYAPDGGELWMTDLPGYSAGPLALDAKGRIFAATDGGVFHQSSLWAIAPDGKVLWSARGGNVLAVSVGPRGTLYTIDAEGTASAFATDGALKWVRSLHAPATPGGLAVSRAGDIYVQTTAAIQSLDAAGRERWSYPIVANAVSEGDTLLLDLEQNVYAVTGTAVIALTSEGRLRWQVPLDGADLLVIGGNGRLYVDVGRRKIVALADDESRMESNTSKRK